MNKKIIGLSAASLALAAIPVIGVSAEDIATTTDNITLTVEKSCTLGVEAASKDVTFDTVTGKTTEALEADGSTFKIVCNDANGWTLTAVGAGTTGHEDKLYNATATHDIETGTTLDGSASNWAFKLTGTGIASGYDSYHAVPSAGAAQTVAEQAAAAAEDTISVKYTVAVDGDAPAGSYTGAVKYTLAAKQAVGP